MKIKEVFTEPEIVQTGSKFLLKVKVQDGLTWEEVRTLTWTQLSQYTFAQLKGD